MHKGNLLIRASAGTGKTFSLATRYLQLMLLNDEDPAKIVALTFSRAAAQEIYTKILERLWKASESEENAAKESENICKDLGLTLSWNKARFSSLLRNLLEAQHLGTIATLDSFILRMVRNFPLEVGFQHAVEVLDPADEGAAVQDALRVILQGTDKVEDFIKVFEAAREGVLPRVLKYLIESMLKGWRGFVELHPESREWTASSMCAALGIPEKPELPDLSGLNTAGTSNPCEKFIQLAMAYDGTGDLFPDNNTGKMMRHLVRNPQTTVFSWTTPGGKERSFDYGVEGAAKIRAAIKCMFNVYVLRRLKKVEAQLKFAWFVEDVYNRTSRGKGKLTFSDFTKFSAAKEGSEQEFVLQNLEYRFDEKFNHWALDEFQDTSELQWQCLRNLVKSAADAAGDEKRTVMVVGDLKQSIYTWRGGNDAPFKEMMSWGSFNDGEFGCCRDSVTSYRYEKNICDFINKVFGPENIRKTLGEYATATGDWLDPDCWKEHKPDVDKGGQPKANDHVKVIGVPDSTNKAKMASLLPALADGLKRIWKEHEETGSTESIGILVRTNDDGKAIAEHLRSLTPPIPVVWEGFSAVSDVPVVNALVDLLRLSEHPEDTFAWKTVSELFPICSTLFAKPKVGDLTAKCVSSIVAKKLSHQGLSRTLQEFSRALSVDSVGLDELSKLRLREMVGVAVAYEERNASRFSLDGFEAFLAASHKRELGASSHVVRILTIHRSKGLTLDRVFVPIAEGVASGIANPGNGGLLYVKDGQWVLPNMSAELLALNPELSRARQEMADDELLSNIRTYYVALTRARKAMYVFLPQPADESAETFFRDVVNAAFETKDTPRPKLDDGNEVIFEQGLEPAFHNPKDDETKDDNTSEGLARQAWEHRGTAKPIERVSPSSAGHRDFVFAGHSASGLFAANAGAAAKKGVEVHGEFERIEWAAAEELEKLPAAFREAFEKPSPEATVWREKSYEIFRADGDKGEWETGQFDRVVFKRTGDDRSAIIYDFKTDARGENESDVAFTDRMRILHQGQMDMYVHALAMLTGIPLERIAAKLLLVSTGTALTIKKE